MVWASTLATLIGLGMVLSGRRLESAGHARLAEEEGPTALVGIGILLMLLGSCLGIVTTGLLVFGIVS